MHVSGYLTSPTVQEDVQGVHFSLPLSRVLNHELHGQGWEEVENVAHRTLGGH